jgi:hypothetical protein
VNKLSLAFAVGSIGSMLLGITKGCGTTESPGGRLLPTEGGTGGAPGITDSGGTGSSRTPIGRACLKDADCGGRGIICLASTSKDLLGGGPPNGMCVIDCSADETLCDASSLCIGFQSTSTAFCMQRCSVGPTQTGDEKCHSRKDVACDDSPGVGFCRPVCRNDRDCGTRKCDLGSGFCRDAVDLTGTLAIGSPCDPNAAVDKCLGSCVPLTSPDAGLVSGGRPGMCAGFCTIGGLGCGSDTSAQGALPAACLFDGTNQGGDVGDIGLCGQLCDCNDECKAYQRTCRPFPSAEQQGFGRKGYCGGVTDSTTGKPAENLPCGTVPPTPDSGGAKDAGSD